jgi:hypothetical protein
VLKRLISVFLSTGAKLEWSTIIRNQMAMVLFTFRTLTNHLLMPSIMDCSLKACFCLGRLLKWKIMTLKLFTGKESIMKESKLVLVWLALLLPLPLQMQIACLSVIHALVILIGHNSSILLEIKESSSILQSLKRLIKRCTSTKEGN